jgi:hypothetical protein
MPIDSRALLAKLPQDPREAIIIIGTRMKSLLVNKAEGGLSEGDAHECCAIIRRFAAATKIGFELPPKKPEATWKRNLGTLVSRIQKYSVDSRDEIVGSKIDELIQEYQAASQTDRFGFAFLEVSEKQNIHQHINAIRKIAETTRLSEKKKRALFDRLNNLAAEVDKNGTKTDAFFAFLGDLSLCAGDMAENAKPAIDRFKEILEIVVRNRAKQEGVKLPSPESFRFLTDQTPKP